MFGISDEIKRARIESVTGLKGSSHLDAWFLCVYIVVSSYLRDSLVSLLVARFAYFRGLLGKAPGDKTHPRRNDVAFAVDFAAMILPNIFICVFAVHALSIFFGTILLAFIFQLLAHGRIAFRPLWQPTKPCYEINKVGDNATKVNVWFFRQANSMLLMGTVRNK